MKNAYQPMTQFTDLAGDDAFANLPVDKGQCLLLGPTALIVQGLMGGLVIASLVLKRYREKPMRPWRIWAFDVSKQIIGQAFVHGLNLLISDIVANISQGNPCDLYFLNILLDTTIGIGYIYLMLHLADRLFSNYFKLDGFKSGQYGDPPSFSFWFRQASIYVLIILTMKLLIVGLFALWPGIFDIAEFLLSWTDGKDRLRIIFVMGIFPIIMNVLQFWLIDSIVKASASIQLNRSATDPIRQPLFHNPSHDSDDEGGEEEERIDRRRDIESPPTPQKTYHQNETSNTEVKSTTSGSSSTIVADSSSVQVHRYPPSSSSSSLSSTSDSPISAAESPIATYRPKKSRRRSPPPPISKPSAGLEDGLHYTISSTPSPMPIKQFNVFNVVSDNYTTQSRRQPTRTTSNLYPQAHTPQSSVAPSSPWTTLVNDTDWADRVGQDEWDSRRLDKKNDLDLWSRQIVLEVS